MGATPDNNKGKQLAEINVTPLVDVVLVLLIIFMIAAPMMKSGIDINLPKTTAGKPIEANKLVITLTKKGEIFIDDKEIHPGIFEEKIKKIAKLKNEVFLQADESVPYGKVIKLLGMLKKNGIENVSLVVNPIEEKNGKISN
ncbi:biopolymer transport protein TolR [Thermotomaculum hydrothermale]|uniref:Biopolymer transport protein TolR n=1 Tax=Thermotomaculum hydrothermale TaxID=981385 RepID=A0A7R6T0B2_9BACT|nr:biopolymer transporter ExbD [Thermotomaculum hydrothermale]BBB33570.1 biopolymer transport protein TolR [Thermotomaculum hydrothermale]